MHGDCAACGFPLSIVDYNPVNCPFCAVTNQPINQRIGGLIISPTIIWLVLAVGVLVLAQKGK